MHLFFLLPQQFAGTCRDAGFAALHGSAAEQWCAFPDLAGKRGWRARGERAEWFLEEDHTWEKFPFAALLPRDVFAEVARAARGLLLRKARMASLHRRRFSSALAHDSNLAEGFFAALIAALRCFRSAIALSVAVFFIQRLDKHCSQQTATGIPPAPRRRQINAVRQTNGPRRFPQRSKGLDPKWLRTMMMMIMMMMMMIMAMIMMMMMTRMMMMMTMMMMQWKMILRKELVQMTNGCTKRRGKQWNAHD